MIYKSFIIISMSIFCSARPPVSLSGLLSSSDLNQTITTPKAKKKPRISLSGEISQADLSQVVQTQVPHKQMIFLSGLLSSNQLNSTIQFMYNKQKQAKSLSGLISGKDLNRSIVWTHKKKKPRVNLSSLLVQNYLDPDYQAAFKILNNSQLQHEYEVELQRIQTYFKRYYISSGSTTSTKKSVIELPKICCPAQGLNYTLCQTE